MAEHRVPMLGAALRRASLRGRPDPEDSPDPKVRELVAALSTLEIAPAPRPQFRAELRAQLVAVTPRLVAEGAPSAVTEDERAEQSRRRSPVTAAAEPRRRFRFAKPLIAAACVLTAFVVLLGGAVWISRKALPGDALYGLKRASENTEYGLTGGTVAKARLKLEFAGNRIDEVSRLLPRAGAMGAGAGDVADGGLNGETASLVRQTLSSANGDVTDAARMLTQAATQNHSPKPLAVLVDWAPGQLNTMKTHVVERIPTGASTVKADAVHTWTLINDALQAAQRRQQALRSVPSPTPSTAPASTQPAPPGSRPGSGTSRGSSPASPASPAATGTPGQVRPSGTRTPAAPGTRTGTPSAPPASGATTKPGLPLPSGLLPSGLLPSGLLPGGLLPGAGTTSGGSTGSNKPALPVTIDTCGIKASLGPLGIDLGSC